MNTTKMMIGSLLIGSVAFFSACQKDAVTGGFAGVDITSARNEAFADNESAKVDDIVNIVTFDNYSGVRGVIDQLPSCAVVTYDTLSYPKSVKIDFGTTPCLSTWDNKYRTGVINISWTGAMKDVGTVKTISTENYYVGSTTDSLNHFQYVKTITNMGLNDNGNWHFTIEVPAATITMADGSVITWMSHRDREWIQGFSTPDPADDVFLITGGSSGTNVLGNAFTVEITTPLMKDACPWIVSGIKEITTGSNQTRIIDYGNGNCDDIAIVKVNGVDKVIHI